ncbi:succinate dehydrogenase assembly factor 2 [Bartonella sp. W8097]|uniref:FAD assembly factor SdhE n=1 Tax=Bartonella apihabitans TaxID=2750929 RepID=UPI0018DC02F2|nr:succinate dehydrogenase assembly factor 2 [Bartonella apihabitans]MBI0021245.1 succinate dehydrogenase assembly factor 2 [Bartonella apihabitans]
MTGSKVDNSKLNARQRRLVFRAWHRGIREMDLVFGQYVDAHIMKLDEKAMDELEYIMSFEDRDLLTWVTGEVPVPYDVDLPLFRDILDYRTRMDFNA